jgi:lariat debranching enzyme
LTFLLVYDAASYRPASLQPAGHSLNPFPPQALRNTHDFAHLAVPPKYRDLGTFHEYYAERKRAEVLTIVIGGNHESSGYMWEL